MKVRYSRQAIADLLGIADYIRAHNPSAAVDVETAIKTTIGLLAEYPGLGRDRPELRARALGVPRYPYTAYYRIEQDEIWVVHVRDDRRKPLEPGDL